MTDIIHIGDKVKVIEDFVTPNFIISKRAVGEVKCIDYDSGYITIHFNIQGIIFPVIIQMNSVLREYD